MKICVTKKDIANGTPTEPDCCPIALALIRAGFNDVSVDTDNVRLFVGKPSLKLPQKAIDFIEQFDNGEEVDPFTFELKLP